MIRLGKGQMGSARMGSLQIFTSFDEWGQHYWGRCKLDVFWQRDFLGTAVKPTFVFPKVPGRTFFPNLSEFVTSAAAPLVLTPFVCDQLGSDCQSKGTPPKLSPGRS